MTACQKEDSTPTAENTTTISTYKIQEYYADSPEHAREQIEHFLRFTGHLESESNKMLEDFPDVEPNQAAWILEGALNYLYNINLAKTTVSESIYQTSISNSVSTAQEILISSDELANVFSNIGFTITNSSSNSPKLIDVNTVSVDPSLTLIEYNVVSVDLNQSSINTPTSCVFNDNDIGYSVFLSGVTDCFEATTAGLSNAGVWYTNVSGNIIPDFKPMDLTGWGFQSTPFNNCSYLGFYPNLWFGNQVIENPDQELDEVYNMLNCLITVYNNYINEDITEDGYLADASNYVLYGYIQILAQDGWCSDYLISSYSPALGCSEFIKYHDIYIGIHNSYN